MAPIRTLAAQTPSIVISVLALAFSLGGGGAYAATHLSAKRAPAVSAVTFHKLTLTSGWGSSQSQFHSGDPSVGISNGIVYLSGSMHRTLSTATKFATLPQQYRPAHIMWMPVYTLNGAVGSVEISANGQMSAFGGNSTSFTSLAGISYPVSS